MISPKSMLLPFAFKVLVLGGPAFGQSRPSDSELAQTLRAGGNVIVIRHGATNEDMADTDPLNHDNIAKQRQLSPKGEEAAKALGVAFKSIGVPRRPGFHEPLQSSLPNRKAGRLRQDRKEHRHHRGRPCGVTEREQPARCCIPQARELRAAGRKQQVFVTHKPNIIDAFGNDWFEVKEGEASIFRPDGSGYKLVARVQMDEWSRIAAASKK